MPNGVPPLAEHGLFSITASSTINAPVDKVWDALLDFPSYVHWYRPNFLEQASKF